VYEDFVNSYEDLAIEILEYLKIPHQENLIFGKRQFKKQADALTNEWIQKYRSTFKDTQKM